MNDPLKPRTSPRPLSWPDIVPELQKTLRGARVSVYLVGGAVRDAFWGQPAHDIDLVVQQDALRIARKIADQFNGAFYKLDAERQTGRAILNFSGQRMVPIEGDV